MVTCSPRLTTGEVGLRELARRFGRPIMGGIDRKGVIATGTDEEIRRAVTDVLQAAPDRFILGADCTVPERGAVGGAADRDRDRPRSPDRLSLAVIPRSNGLDGRRGIRRPAGAEMADPSGPAQKKALGMTRLLAAC